MADRSERLHIPSTGYTREGYIIRDVGSLPAIRDAERGFKVEELKITYDDRLDQTEGAVDAFNSLSIPEARKRFITTQRKEHGVGDLDGIRLSEDR